MKNFPMRCMDRMRSNTRYLNRTDRKISRPPSPPPTPAFLSALPSRLSGCRTLVSEIHLVEELTPEKSLSKLGREAGSSRQSPAEPSQFRVVPPHLRTTPKPARCKI